jgi:hypothetical protein
MPRFEERNKPMVGVQFLDAIHRATGDVDWSDVKNTAQFGSSVTSRKGLFQAGSASSSYNAAAFGGVSGAGFTNRAGSGLQGTTSISRNL